MAPSLERTAIDGLLVLHLDVRGDNRGWFKENWQRAKMLDLGLPDFGPVQNNVSFNTSRGATRGFHAEPWDKLVSIATGRIFGAWVDLREGAGFGTTVTLELGPQTAVFVPRGVGNAFQTLADDVAYSYLVNDHWSPQARDSYTFVNLADETLAVGWPVPLAEAELSQADRDHPRLADAVPFRARRPLVLGGHGQLGAALAVALPGARVAGRDEIDLTDPDSLAAVAWGEHDVVVNAAAYTAVDAAETPEGRVRAWDVNVAGTQALVEHVRRAGTTLVHVSSDYVFDGTRADHPEDEPLSPLGVYGQTKAAADVLVGTLPQHYVVRTSWVVGEGRNFVRTMAGLADRGVDPRVIDDQVGRLTFTDELARGIVHLLGTGAPYGTYNLTGGGEPTSWADVARAVYAARGRDPQDVTPVSTAEYTGDRDDVAPRPALSTLDLMRIRATGFEPRDAADSLADYVAGLGGASDGAGGELGGAGVGSAGGGADGVVGGGSSLKTDDGS